MVRRTLQHLDELFHPVPTINNAPPDVIHAICECCLNLLKGVIPFTPHQKRRLVRHKTHIRALVNKKVSQKKKRRYLSQKGGGTALAALLPCRFGRSWEFILKKHEAYGVSSQTSTKPL